MTTQKQLAITKTPAGHGTYCIRVKMGDGEATMEYLSHRAQTYDELIESLRERIADLERLKAGA